VSTAERWAVTAPAMSVIARALEPGYSRGDTPDDLAELTAALLAFDLAEREKDPARCEAWLAFDIVSAGPTGVDRIGNCSDPERCRAEIDVRGRHGLTMQISGSWSIQAPRT
jgi:hypothetical protein